MIHAPGYTCSAELPIECSLCPSTEGVEMFTLTNQMLCRSCTRQVQEELNGGSDELHRS